MTTKQWILVLDHPGWRYPEPLVTREGLFTTLYDEYGDENTKFFAIRAEPEGCKNKEEFLEECFKLLEFVKNKLEEYGDEAAIAADWEERATKYWNQVKEKYGDMLFT